MLADCWDISCTHWNILPNKNVLFYFISFHFIVCLRPWVIWNHFNQIVYPNDGICDKCLFFSRAEWVTEVDHVSNACLLEWPQWKPWAPRQGLGQLPWLVRWFWLWDSTSKGQLIHLGSTSWTFALSDCKLYPFLGWLIALRMTKKCPVIPNESLNLGVISRTPQCSCRDWNQGLDLLDINTKFKSGVQVEHGVLCWNGGSTTWSFFGHVVLRHTSLCENSDPWTLVQVSLVNLTGWEERKLNICLTCQES
jgi:hypothetical protein